MISFDYREHFPFRVKIRNKIIIPFLCLAMIVTLIAIRMVTSIFRDKMHDVLVTEMRRSSAALNDLIADRLKLLLDMAKVYGHSSAVRNPSIPTAGMSFDDGLVDRAVAADFLAASCPPPEAAVLTRHGLGDAVGYLEGADKKLFLFACTSPGNGGQGAAVVREDAVALILDRATKVGAWQAVVFDSSGNCYGSTPMATEVGRRLLAGGVKRAINLNDSTWGWIKGGGGNDLYFHFPLEAGGRRVASCAFIRSDEDLVNWQSAIQRDVLVLGVAMVLLFLAVYALVIIQLTKPIRQLTKAADKVARGDFTTTVNINSRDEIGRLAEAFQKMTIYLRLHRRELQEATLKIIHQEKLATLGQMLAGIMHEIKNPLNSLRIMLKVAEGERDPRELAACLARMDDEIKRMARTAEGLLSLASKPRFSLEEVDVNSRIRSFLGLIEGLLNAQGVEVILELAPALPKPILDVGQVDQILYNLIFNSIQAMEKGRGVLTVKTALRPGTGTEKCINHLVVTVEDNGVGIPASNLEKIFDPFFTSKPPGEGTGLGLSIVKSVVEEYGGRVGVSSVVGRGTTVEVFFTI